MKNSSLNAQVPAELQSQPLIATLDEVIADLSTPNTWIFWNSNQDQGLGVNEASLANPMSCH